MELPPTPLAFDFFSGPEMLLVLAVVLIFFGGDKMPGFARGLGKAIREFKKATGDVEREFKRVMDEAENPPAIMPPPKPAVPPSPSAPSLAVEAKHESPDTPTSPGIALDQPPDPPLEEGPGAHHTDV
jgi:sec-independent protein translocase protein TatA